MVILLPLPPRMLGLRVCAIMPGSQNTFKSKHMILASDATGRLILLNIAGWTKKEVREKTCEVVASIIRTRGNETWREGRLNRSVVTLVALEVPGVRTMEGSEEMKKQRCETKLRSGGALIPDGRKGTVLPL